MAGIDFNNYKGSNLGDPKFGQDAVNLRTLNRVVATASGNSVSAVVSGITAGNNISITGTTSAITVSLISNVTTTSIDAGTIFSAGTDLYSIFITQNDGNDITRVKPGSNITTGGTGNLPIINLVSSPSIDGLTFSGSAIGNSFSANTISGGTLYSGSTDLYSIFSTPSSGVQTLGQGSNIVTGGTMLNPIVNVVSSPSFNNISFSGVVTGNGLSANTISGGTLYSGSTDLYSIFLTQNDGNDITRVQPGSNITTGGTANNPTVNIVDSPSFNNISFSGVVTGNGLSANTLSGGTILSGNTDLYSIFTDGTGTANILPLWLNSTGTLTNSIITQSGTGVTVSGSVNILGNVDILGTATTFNTQTVQSLDNNILLNYSGTYITAYGGGITVLSGRSNGAPSTWTIDSNGSWSANTDIIASALTINNGNINVTSGGQLQSGGTDLYSIFTSYVTGATFVQPTQIAFGSSTSGLTSSTGLTFSGGVLNVGNATTTNQRQVRIGQDTAFVDIGSIPGSPTIPGIWFNSTAPALSDSALWGTTTTTVVNGVQAVSVRTNNGNRIQINASTQLFTPLADSSGAITPFTFTVPENTNQTLSTNIPNFIIKGNNKQWATGDLATQHFNYFSANTISFAGASTATTVGGLVVDYTKVGTNAFVTNNCALYVPFDYLSATTNAYGAYFNAPTGATNNYALGVSGDTMFVTNVNTTNFYPYFTFKAGSVDCLRVLAAGTGNGAEVRVGGGTGANWLRVAGTNTNPFVLDSGLGGVDNDTFIAFHRNGSSRWTLGKAADNNFRLINVASGQTAMTVNFSTGEVNLMRLKVTGETVTNNFSASTLFVKGLGSTSATTAVTISNSAGTNIMTLLDNGNVNIGNYSGSASQRIFTVGQDTAFLSIGSITSPTTSVGLYANQTIPSNTNYNLNINSSNSFLNAASGVNLQIGASTKYALTNTTHTWSVGQVAAASSNTFTFTSPHASTSIAGTNIQRMLVSTNSTQWNTGALPEQDFILFSQPSISFIGASTATTTSTFSIGGAPSAGTNSTLFVSSALLIKQGIVNSSGGTVNTSFGALINAQSGATTNYAIGTNGNVIVTGNTFISSALTASTIISPTIYGSTSPNGTLLIDSTSNSTKGPINFGSSGNSNVHNFYVGTASTLVSIREKVGVTSQGAIYLGVPQGTESSTNYMLNWDGTLRINGQTSTSTVSLLAGNVGLFVITPGSTTSSPFFDFQPRTRTSLTTATNVPVFNINSSLQTWATGAMDLQCFANFKTQTIGFAGGSTVSLLAGVSIAPPTVGSNALVTTGAGLYIPQGIMSSTTTGFGALINATSGATTNYAIGTNGNVIVTGNTFISSALTSSTIAASSLSDITSGTTRMVEASSGGTLSATKQVISAFGMPASAQTQLSLTSNWDLNGDYTGTTLSNVYQGQMYYDGGYFFMCVADNTVIRLIRG